MAGIDLATLTLAKNYTNSTTQEVISKLAGGLRYQGSVDSLDDLPTPTEENKGHLYTLTTNGHEYVSDGTQWIDLSKDLDDKADKTALTAEITARTNADNSLNTAINTEITNRTNKDTELETAISAKQNKLTNINAGVGININNEIISANVDNTTIKTNSEGKLFAEHDSTKANVDDLTSLDERVQEVENKIPAQATVDNKLADKNFVNSSISTNTANYISKDGQPFTSVEELEAYTGTITNNDYAFVTGTDEAGNTYFDRYKATVSETSKSWAKEYRLNNSSFTAEQWAAISSGITGTLVNKIISNESNISNINSKIPAEATTSNKLADKAYVDAKADSFIRGFTVEVTTPFNAYELILAHGDGLSEMVTSVGTYSNVVGYFHNVDITVTGSYINTAAYSKVFYNGKSYAAASPEFPNSQVKVPIARNYVSRD